MAKSVIKVHSSAEMQQTAGTCCRQSPVRSIVGSLIVCSFLIGFVLVLWQRGVHWLFWGGCAALAALLVPWFIADALAKLHSMNWLVRLGSDGLWINLRSYQNRGLPMAETVVHLPYKEIASARRHLESWSTPMEPSSLSATHWKQESLDLTIVSGQTREIARALVEERQRRAIIKGMHQAVTVPTQGVVRIAWRGHGNDVVPSLTRVLEELGQRVKVQDATRTDRGDWSDLSETELDELVAQLARSGDDLVAVQLLTRRRGYSHAEAQRYVDEQASRI